MSFRNPKQSDRSRARTPEDKLRVREAFIVAGRELFSEGDPSKISLRQIAAQAGYAPGAIYQYFADQRDLFASVREHDMHQASQELEKAIARTRDPVQRVRKLFFATVDYWLEHMDHFLVLFPAPRSRAFVATPGTQPFGRSPVVQKILGLYYDSVQEMFDSLPRHPMPPRLATDILLASVYGTLVFPLMTRTMEWSDTRTMARKLIQTVLDQWVSEAQEEEPSGPGRQPRQ